MRIVLIVYLFLTAAMFCYVSGMCFRKRMAPGAGTVGLLIAALGAGLAWAAILGVV